MPPQSSISKEHYRKQLTILEDALASIESVTRSMEDSRVAAYALDTIDQLELTTMTKTALNQAWVALVKAKTRLIQLERIEQ